MSISIMVSLPCVVFNRYDFFSISLSLSQLPITIIIQLMLKTAMAFTSD